MSAPHVQLAKFKKDMEDNIDKSDWLILIICYVLVVISTIYNQCVHIRNCAAFCCSEEKREEAEGGNGNGKLYKEGVVSSGSG